MITMQSIVDDIKRKAARIRKDDSINKTATENVPVHISEANLAEKLKDLDISIKRHEKEYLSIDSLEKLISILVYETWLERQKAGVVNMDGITIDLIKQKLTSNGGIRIVEISTASVIDNVPFSRTK